MRENHLFISKFGRGNPAPTIGHLLVNGGHISYIVDLRINETFQTGAGGNRTYRGGESVYL